MLSTRIKHLITDNGYSLKSFGEEYNRQYNTRYNQQSFNRKINEGSIRANEIDNILNILGYEIVFRRKRDADQWNCFSKFNLIRWIKVAKYIWITVHMSWITHCVRCAYIGIRCIRWCYVEIPTRCIDIRWMYRDVWDICSSHRAFYTTDIWTVIHMLSMNSCWSWRWYIIVIRMVTMSIYVIHWDSLSLHDSSAHTNDTLLYVILCCNWRNIRD